MGKASPNNICRRINVRPRLIGRSHFMGAVFVGCLGWGNVCLTRGDAAQPAKDQPTTSQAASSPSAAGSAPQDQKERAVLTMVRRHLPELHRMLQRLRMNDRSQYRVAIDDLENSLRRLEAARRRDDRLFEIEVALLQARTAVSMATAKLKVRDDPADRQLLREAIVRLKQADQRRAEYDVEMFRKRLARVEQQLRQAEQRLESKTVGSDERIEATFQSLLRRAGRGPDG